MIFKSSLRLLLSVAYTTSNSSTEDNYELVSTEPSDRAGRTSPQSSFIRDDVNFSTSHCYGSPIEKTLIDWLDFVALAFSVLCLATSVLIVSPSLPFAAKLGYTVQIIGVSMLLGIMNQCLQRIMPYCLILIESRYGRFTIQNYEGLLGWSPFANQLNFVWRLSLTFLILLPLILSVLYKRFTGGSADTTPLRSVEASYTPTAPPGLQVNVKGITIMANMTTPFLSAIVDDGRNHARYLSETQKVFGFNIVLLSNTSAAAMDGPVPSRVSSLQQGLPARSSYYLTANVRGTVVQYNKTVDDHRQDKDYWTHYYGGVSLATAILWNGFYFGMIQNGDGAGNWDGSWFLAGTINVDGVDEQDENDMRNAFERTAMRFDVKRHACEATWRITQNSIELVSGQCETDPLEAKYQYISDSRLGLASQYVQILGECLGPFATARNQPAWRVTTHAVVIASIYQAKIAAGLGHVPIQIHGSIWNAWNSNRDDNYNYNETYKSDEILTSRVPTLQAAGALYWVLAIQPVLTVAASYHVPIARTFGLLSILAGVSRESLKLLHGAAFSGKTSKPRGLSITVISTRSDTESTSDTIKYRIGDFGIHGSIKRQTEYG